MRADVVHAVNRLVLTPICTFPSFVEYQRMAAHTLSFIADTLFALRYAQVFPLQSTTAGKPKASHQHHIPVWDGMMLIASQQAGASSSRGCEPVVLTTLTRDAGYAIIKVC